MLFHQLWITSPTHAVTVTDEVFQGQIAWILAKSARSISAWSEMARLEGERPIMICGNDCLKLGQEWENVHFSWENKLLNAWIHRQYIITDITELLHTLAHVEGALMAGWHGHLLIYSFTITYYSNWKLHALKNSFGKKRKETLGLNRLGAIGRKAKPNIMDCMNDIMNGTFERIILWILYTKSVLSGLCAQNPSEKKYTLEYF